MMITAVGTVAIQKVHRGIISTDRRIIEIPGAGDPADRSVSHAVIAFEKITQVIPVTAIPLCPPAPGWEAAHLVEPAGIPRFCDQLHIAEDRIAGQALQKRRLFHRHSVLISTEDTGQIETESVHMVGSGPVTQAVQDQLAHDGVIAV